MKLHVFSIGMGLAVGFALHLSSSTALANVYASNIKINGSQANLVGVGQGSSVNISYILNEAATAGVTVKILSGANVVRSISIVSGSGTTKGSNSVVWDGKDGTGATVPLGAYSVSITAAATGYTDWTQISDDAAATSYCMRPRGIAVNNNTNSPYYGRIFIGNSRNGPGLATNAWGEVPGLYKVNADGSPSDDGAGRYGTAGYNFSDASHYDGGSNPIGMKVKEDDRLYWNDWVGYCEVVACDMLLTTNQIVMPEGYYSSNPYYFPASTLYYGWRTFQVTDLLTDHPRIYLNDANYPSGGSWYWSMTNGAVNVNDPAGTTGTQALQTGGDLSLRCDGIVIDAHTNLYAIQNRANPGDPNMRACCFTNWDGVTPLVSGASWVVGGGDDTFRNEYDLALDSLKNPHYLAVSMSVLDTNSISTNVAWAGIRILNAVDGSTVVSNLSVASSYHGVAWDNVGNLYGGSQSASRWRVFSPPGANQATTTAFSTMDVIVPPTPPQISTIAVSAGTATIRFTAGSGDAAGDFTLETSATVTGTFGSATGAMITKISAGVFEATVPISGPAGFYRIKR